MHKYMNQPIQHRKDIKMNFENENSKDGCDGGDDGDKKGKNEFEEQIIMMSVLTQINVFCPQKQSPQHHHQQQQQQLSQYCQLEQKTVETNVDHDGGNVVSTDDCIFFKSFCKRENL